MHGCMTSGARLRKREDKNEIAGKNVGGKCGEAVKLRFIVGMSAYVWLRVRWRARACERACVCECTCVCVRANDCVCSNADGCMGILWHGRRRRGGGRRLLRDQSTLIAPNIRRTNDNDTCITHQPCTPAIVHHTRRVLFHLRPHETRSQENGAR